MKVLIACEFSGTVRDAFTAAGHEALSCDLLPTESPGPHHQGDVRDILDQGWDLMIAHPPCTYLTNSGVRWLYSEELRWQKMIEGAVFFRDLLTADIPRVAVENPVMHGWASQIVGQKQSQVIQPWQFGHTETKATGLWLRGLPPLLATGDERAVMAGMPVKETARVHHLPPSEDRWKLRSLTYTGIAQAMVDQWGDL